MVERLRSNGLSIFAENVSWPGRAVTAADLRNLVGFKGLREGDRGRNGQNDPFCVRVGARLARETVAGRRAGTRICGFLDPVVDCTTWGEQRWSNHWVG